MSSEPFSPSNAYQAPPAPAPAKLDRESWNAVMGSIAERLGALEAKRTELQDLINDLSFNGQARLDEAIVPLITQTQAQIDELQRRVAETIAANGAIIETFQEDIAEALASLNAQIAAVERRVDTILQGGIPAADVAETADRVFVTPTQREEIGQLREDLTSGLAGKLSNNFQEVKTNNLANGAVTRAKIASATYSTQSEAVAGVSTEGAMSPLRVSQAIAALGTDISLQVFTSSGNFIKELDDVAYFVELIGGGGAGGAGTTSPNRGSGGGGGGFACMFLLATEASASTLVTIGAGGAGTSVTGAGGSGGDTSFGPHIRGLGGKGGGESGGGDGGGGESGASAVAGGPRAGGGYASGGGGGRGGSQGANSVMGGAGGGQGSASAHLGGVSVRGGNGGAGGTTGGPLPSPGQAPGGGGGGVEFGGGAASGAGARGEARVYRIKRKKA